MGKETFSEMFEGEQVFLKRLKEALLIYKGKGGIEVAFTVSRDGDSTYCSRISEGTKTSPISENMSEARVEIPWEDKPVGHDHLGGFHTHPALEEPSIHPSADDMSTLVIVKIMIIGQTLLSGEFGLLVVDRGHERILLDDVFTEPFAEVPHRTLQDKDMILANDRLYFTQEWINVSLEELGCRVHYFQFDSLEKFLDTLASFEVES